MKHICERCSSEFNAPPCQKAKFCNRDCYNKSREGHFNCVQCGKQFIHYKSHKRGDKVFCSQKCHFAYIKSHQSHQPGWKGGRVKDGKGYIKIFMGGKGSKRYQLEHRLVMEEALGRKLNSNEIVHHINGVKTDNRIENLEIMSRGEHVKHHAPRLGTAS